MARTRNSTAKIIDAVLPITGLPHHSADVLLDGALILPQYRGIRCPIELVHETTNQHDSNAVMVRVPASATTHGEPVMLGYIPRRFAEKVRKWLYAAATMAAAIDVGELEAPETGVVWHFDIQADAEIPDGPGNLSTAEVGAFSLPFFKTGGLASVRPVRPARQSPRRRRETIRVWL